MPTSTTLSSPASRFLPPLLPPQCPAVDASARQRTQFLRRPHLARERCSGLSTGQSSSTRPCASRLASRCYCRTCPGMLLPWYRNGSLRQRSQEGHTIVVQRGAPTGAWPCEGRWRLGRHSCAPHAGTNKLLTEARVRHLVWEVFHADSDGAMRSACGITAATYDATGQASTSHHHHLRDVSRLNKYTRASLTTSRIAEPRFPN